MPEAGGQVWLEVPTSSLSRGGSDAGERVAVTGNGRRVILRGKSQIQLEGTFTMTVAPKIDPASYLHEHLD